MASVSAASINFGCPFNPARSVTAIQNTSISVSTINHASPSERFSRFRLSASMKPDILRVVELVNKQIAEKNENRGSVEFQVFSMTNKIRRLTQHLEEHKKDFASERGLKITLGKRKRLLAYLRKKLKKGGSLAF